MPPFHRQRLLEFARGESTEYNEYAIDATGWTLEYIRQLSAYDFASMVAFYGYQASQQGHGMTSEGSRKRV